MNGYLAFLKKEQVENAKTYKLFIMLIVFLVLGIMNPLTAKLTPELLTTLMPEGLSIELPTPSALDSWAQFFKNVPQLGLIVMVIVFSGTLSAELTRGTLINLLTKGLDRVAVIAAKLSSMMLIWTVSLALAFVVTWAYTIYLFPGEQVVHLAEAVSYLWLFGLFLLAGLMLAATCTASNWGALLITGAVVEVGLSISIIPQAYQYNPLSLASLNMSLIHGTVSPTELTTAVVITLALTLSATAGAILIFRRRLL